MKRFSRFPPILYLFATLHVLADAFQKVSLNRSALRIFSKLRMNSVVVFSSHATQFRQGRQVGRILDPPKNIMTSNWFASLKCSIKVAAKIGHLLPSPTQEYIAPEV